jgi:hypothetical protein
MSDPLPDFVFEDVSADLFQHGTLHVLVYADRLSGWPVVHQWRRDPTAREVVQAVVHNFVELGVPMRFRSDNGPQFQDTLNRWGVAWGNSTPHYHQSNGYAEAAVKAVKELVAKTAPSGDLSSEDFLAGLLEFRNTPHECGLSPAQIVFCHQLRSVIPAHRSSFAPKWKDAIIARERQAAAAADTKLRYDTRTRPLAPISIGTPVRIQDPISKLWSHVGVIVAVGRYRSYRVKFASGSVLWRNRRFIRPMVPAGNGEKRAEDSPSDNGPMCEESGDVTIPGSIQRRPIRHRKALGAGLVSGRRRLLYLFDLFTMEFQSTPFRLYAGNVTSVCLKRVYFCLLMISLLLQFACVGLYGHWMIIGVFVSSEGSGGVVMYSECTR